jgi:hypothetical protein
MEYRRGSGTSERIFGGPEYLHSVVGDSFCADRSFDATALTASVSECDVVVACVTRVSISECLVACASGVCV